MGRKALSGERKSERPLRIRLTDAERTLIDDAAARVGKPASTWGREILLREAAKMKK
jgi:uncharacterized protein (DUF1778 family)